jgi:N utilization substance protein B
MGARRAARELALQALYRIDMLGEEEGPAAFAVIGSEVERAPEVEAFARELVEGVRTNLERIDGLIATSAEHWRLPRLSRVDLNLLRLATFELLGRSEIPTSVTINEAVEIARRFGTEDSGAFVNGVLDHIAEVLGVKERPSE